MICQHCGQPITHVTPTDEYTEPEWQHSLTGRTSCDTFAAPRRGPVTLHPQRKVGAFTHDR